MVPPQERQAAKIYHLSQLSVIEALFQRETVGSVAPFPIPNPWGRNSTPSTEI